jgi:DNA polymerase-1
MSNWLERFKATIKTTKHLAFSKARPIEPLAPIAPPPATADIVPLRPPEKPIGTKDTNIPPAETQKSADTPRASALRDRYGDKDTPASKDTLAELGPPKKPIISRPGHRTRPANYTLKNLIDDLNKPIVVPAKPARRFVEQENYGGLQNAIRAAIDLEAEFYVIGDAVEVVGDLPDALRAALPSDQLYEYLGAARRDQEAIEFLARLGVAPVLVTDRAGADAAMHELDSGDTLGLDFETGPPNARPLPIKMNRSGTVAAHQPKASKDGLNPNVSVIQTAQLYAGGAHAYVFHGAGLERLLESEWFATRNFVTHNAAFEAKFAAHRGIALRLQCTMQAVGLLHGVENFSYGKHYKRDLATASKIVLGREPPKDLHDACWSAPRHSAGQVAYAASDSILPYRLWQKMQLELCRKRLWAYALQRDAIPAVVDMERRGLGYHRELHAGFVAKWESDVAALETQILEITGKPALTGRNETQEWLRSVAGDLLPTWPLTPTGLLSTTAADYARLENVPEAGPMLELRARKMLLSNFGEKVAELVDPTTGRLHGYYNIGGTKAGRFSCSNPNLQNQPSPNKAPTYKNIFVAAPGRKIVSGDWRQVELRAMAHISNCPAMIAVFTAGGDFHGETASAMLAMDGKTREEISDEEFKLRRERAKALNFSIIYGVTGEGFAEIAWRQYGLKLTQMEGAAAVAAFFQKYPEVKLWMDRSFVETAQRGYIRIGVGRVVQANWEEEYQLSPQQCANLPIQGVCADLMLRATRLTYDRLRAAQIDGGLIFTVHDELGLEIADADVGRASQILETAMTETFAFTFTGAPMTGGVVDIKVGPSWGELQTPEK